MIGQGFYFLTILKVYSFLIYVKNKKDMKKKWKKRLAIAAGFVGVGVLSYKLGKNHGYTKAIVDLDNSVSALQDKFRDETGKYLAISFDNETLGLKGSTKIGEVGIYHKISDFLSRKNPIIGVHTKQ